LSNPQGLTAEQFSQGTALIRDRLGSLADDVVIQGSRIRGTARLTPTATRKASDIDFGLVVSPDNFSSAVRRSFPRNAGPEVANGRTMIDAIFRGRIFRRQAVLPDGSKLKPLAKDLEKIFGFEVDFSILERGGAFHNNPSIPLPKRP
jgi:predicted nucleotidyltransferase